MLTELLTFEEGYRPRVYRCSAGYPTIGIGLRIGPHGAPLDLYQFTVSLSAAQALLDQHVGEVNERLYNIPWFMNLNDDRKCIIQSMAYQLGVNGMLKFKRMIAAIKELDFKEAAKEALDSKWYRDTPERAMRHAEVLETGDLMATYQSLI